MKSRVRSRLLYLASAYFRRSSIRSKSCCGGDKRASIAAPSFNRSYARVVNGAAQESVPRAAHFKSPANISKSLLRVFSSIPGLPVGLETRKQPYAGSCIQLRPEPCFASGTAVLLPIQELATATAAGHACLDGFKLSLKRGRLCSTGKHRRFDVPAYKWPMVSNSNSLTTDH